MTQGNSYDVLVIGGGVIGLSVAWELAEHGAKVALVERGRLAGEASWAGAGMVPAGPAESHWSEATPFERLEGLSQRLHPEWSERLRTKTGLDNQYRQCGTIHLAATDEEAADLERKIGRWQSLGIVCQPLDDDAIDHLEPALRARRTAIRGGWFVPEEAQFRNPVHNRALVAACTAAGVNLRPGVEVVGFQSGESRLTGVKTSVGSFVAEQYCLAAGCWSGQLASLLGLQLPIRPIRGQIVLVEGPPHLFHHNVYLGPRKYFTPRLDGRVLVGSTQEEAGFEKTNTVAGTADILQFARTLAPATANLPITHQWSGLRPGTADGLPYLGRAPEHENLWLATGHFRSGLQLAPATGVVLRQLILGQTLAVDVSELGANRASKASSRDL